MTGVWVICSLLMPGKLAAQSHLYAEADNLIKIDVPDLPLSMLEISAKGGTIKQTKSPYENVDKYTVIDKESAKYKRYKKGISTYWIAHPSWVLSEYGQRPEFVLTVSVKLGGGKTKVLATKRYRLKTAFIINARKDSHIITSEDLLKDDIILENSNSGNKFNLIFYTPSGKSVSPAEEHPNGLFSEKEKQVLRELKPGSKMYIKFPSYTRIIELIIGE